MLKGNREFIMIDDQKVVYENILQLACKSKADMKKRTIIVEGGPGTGKSVVAINLLAELTKEDSLHNMHQKTVHLDKCILKN